jgi:hypothetical protein
MPQDPNFYLIIGSFLLASIGLVALASLRGWREWIELKRAELDSVQHGKEVTTPSTVSRIEVADLKERVKKLEAIAAGIDL